MHALVLTTNFRNADNWLELFERIDASEGGSCELLVLAWQGDPSHPRLAELEAVLPVRLHRELTHLSPEGISEDEMADLLEQACTDEIDVVFLCDMQSYPSTIVLSLLARSPKRPLVIGLQHGLFQSWWLYNNHFCADHLFVFGDRYVNEIDARYRERVVGTGLPKLDRLNGLSVSGGGYIGHIGQRFLQRDTVAGLCYALLAHTGVPVRTADHPQYAETPPPAATASSAYLDFLGAADWLITGYSTGGVEALYLKKPVVLLPSFGLTAWAGYPGAARDLSLGEVLAAKRRVEAFPSAVDKFLHETVGGLRFDHAYRAWTALIKLVG